MRVSRPCGQQHCTVTLASATKGSSRKPFAFEEDFRIGASIGLDFSAWLRRGNRQA